MDSVAGIAMRVCVSLCVQSHLVASAVGGLPVHSHLHGLHNEGVTQEFVRAWGHTRITPARAQCWGFAQGFGGRTPGWTLMDPIWLTWSRRRVHGRSLGRLRDLLRVGHCQ